jgi:hypothetical protein
MLVSGHVLVLAGVGPTLWFAADGLTEEELEQVALRETDVDITSLALDAQEKQIAWREVDADLASSALTTWEELVTKWEADLAAREQAVKARAEQLE